MIHENVLEAIGHTPIVKLNKMVDSDSADILVKIEGLNIGGSIKTRTAYNMICDAEKRGVINKDTIIVEPTSGNQGIGLSLVGAVRGYKTKIIMHGRRLCRDRRYRPHRQTYIHAPKRASCRVLPQPYRKEDSLHIRRSLS